MLGNQRGLTYQGILPRAILKATRVGILVGLFALAMVAVACAPTKTSTDEWGTVAIQPGEPIKLGFAAALSGEYAKLGTDVQNAVQMALDDKATVHGFTLALQVTDDKCEAGPAAVTSKGLLEKSTFSTFFSKNSAPNFTAWSRIFFIKSGPIIPFSNPG